MLGIGFWELTLIALLGLLIIDPREFPKIAHWLGKMLGKIQQYLNQCKSELTSDE